MTGARQDNARDEEDYEAGTTLQAQMLRSRGVLHGPEDWRQQLVPVNTWGTMGGGTYTASAVPGSICYSASTLK